MTSRRSWHFKAGTHEKEAEGICQGKRKCPKGAAAINLRTGDLSEPSGLSSHRESIRKPAVSISRVAREKAASCLFGFRRPDGRQDPHDRSRPQGHLTQCLGLDSSRYQDPVQRPGRKGRPGTGHYQDRPPHPRCHSLQSESLATELSSLQ